MVDGDLGLCLKTWICPKFTVTLSLKLINFTEILYIFRQTHNYLRVHLIQILDISSSKNRCVISQILSKKLEVVLSSCFLCEIRCFLGCPLFPHSPKWLISDRASKRWEFQTRSSYRPWHVTWRGQWNINKTWKYHKKNQWFLKRKKTYLNWTFFQPIYISNCWSCASNSTASLPKLRSHSFMALARWTTGQWAGWLRFMADHTDPDPTPRHPKKRQRPPLSVSSIWEAS